VFDFLCKLGKLGNVRGFIIWGIGWLNPCIGFRHFNVFFDNINNICFLIYVCWYLGFL
jgi:hypothetical protein